MIIAITGSTCAIGRQLIERLEAERFSVIPLGGRNSGIWKLGEAFPAQIQADVLVHLAHDRELSLDENKYAIDILVRSFKGYQILLSSLSSHSETKSIYGLSKKYAEQQILSTNGGCVRAGIVFGSHSEGFFKMIQGTISQVPVVPLPYSGKSRFFFTHIDDLCSEILDLIQNQKKGIIFGANYWPLTLKEMSKRIAIANGKKTFFIGISPIVTRIFVRVATIFRLKASLIDSLRSLNREITNSEISRLIVPKTKFRSF
jgi:nucleoside-diphosphate-sugar epimerase